MGLLSSAVVCLGPEATDGGFMVWIWAPELFTHGEWQQGWNRQGRAHWAVEGTADLPSCQVLHLHTHTHIYHNGQINCFAFHCLNCSLLCRMRSLKRALELLEPTDIRIKRISDQLDQNVIKTLDITSFAPADLRAIYGDAKVFDVF